MNRTIILKNAILLCISLSMFSSCKGQSTTQVNQLIEQPATAIGDTVKELSSNIMTVYQDKKNKYWFASWEDGLYKYYGKAILHFTTKHGLPHNRVEDIREDEEGNMYFNTTGGVSKFDGQKFSTLLMKESGEWKLQPGDLWFKSPQFDGQVSRYDGKNLYSLKLPGTKLGDEWISKHPTYSDPYAVYTIYKDSKGNVWFGTAAMGACRYNGISFDWISELDVTELHDAPANGVRSIIEDKDGYFWFNFMYRYNVYGKSKSPTQSFYSREKSIGNLDGAADSDFWEYMSIVKDNNKELWIASYGNGVWRYDPSAELRTGSKKTTYYPVQHKGEDITMFSIYKDNHGDLWLGTHENGTYKFNGKTFERFRP